MNLMRAKICFSRVSVVRVSCWEGDAVVGKRELALEECRPIVKMLGDRLKYYASEKSSLLKKRKFIYRPSVFIVNLLANLPRAQPADLQHSQRSRPYESRPITPHTAK